METYTSLCIRLTFLSLKISNCINRGVRLAFLSVKISILRRRSGARLTLLGLVSILRQERRSSRVFECEKLNFGSPKWCSPCFFWGWKSQFYQQRDVDSMNTSTPSRSDRTSASTINRAQRTGPGRKPTFEGETNLKWALQVTVTIYQACHKV